MTGADRPPAMRPGISRRGLVAGAVAAAAVLAVAIAVIFVRQPGQTSGSPVAVPPSMQASASASAATTPSPSAAPSESTDPTNSPEPSPTPLAFDQWELAASFTTEGHAEEVDGVAYAAGHFIAIGHNEPLAARGAVGPPQDTPLMWSSPDGRAWSRVALDDSFTNAHLRSIVALPGGEALVYGFARQAGDAAAPRQTAWRSADGTTWEEVALTAPGSLGPFVVAGGAGYATAVDRNDGRQRVTEVWHSEDGITWEVSELQLRTEPSADPVIAQDSISIRDLAAGDEGFVAAAEFGDWTGDERTDTGMVFASGDGREWLQAEASELPEQPALLVAAVGGDWVLTATDFETGETTIWWSANGLEWEQRASVEVPAPALSPEDLGSGARPIVGDIVGTGRGVILSGAVLVCCHSPWWAAGVWASVDGHRWDRLDMPADAVVTNAVHHNGVTVLGGHTGASPDARWKAVATFWVNDGR